MDPSWVMECRSRVCFTFLKVQALMENKKATRVYDGYTACPVLLGDAWLMGVKHGSPTRHGG